MQEPTSHLTQCSLSNTASRFTLSNGQCVCSTSYGYASRSGSCDLCLNHLAGCLECSSLTQSSICDTTANFQLSSGQCVCSAVYIYVVDQSCQPVCGDGYVRNSELRDHGNLVNGDACDSTCSVETNYTCTRPMSTPSVCGYNQHLEGSLQSVLKDPSKSSVTFRIQFYDFLLLGVSCTSLGGCHRPIENSSKRYARR